MENSIVSYAIPFLAIILIFYFLIIRPAKKKQENDRLNQMEVLNMSMDYFLEQNGLEKYSNIFEKENITTLKTALDLTDEDLKNIGIEAIGDRKKLLSLFNEKQSSVPQSIKRQPQQGTVFQNPEITIHHAIKRGQDASAGFGRAFGETTGTAFGCFVIVLVIIAAIVIISIIGNPQ
jgi:hypothetical protein